MGIRRLFIAESKGTRKKDSALSSGVLDFCTPNKRLVRKRSRATQSSFPDREKGYENIPFFISGQRHVTRQTNSDKKLPAEQLLFVYFPSRSYLTSREATQSRFLFLFSNGNSFIQRRMKIKVIRERLFFVSSKGCCYRESGEKRRNPRLRKIRVIFPLREFLSS